MQFSSTVSLALKVNNLSDITKLAIQHGKSNAI